MEKLIDTPVKHYSSSMYMCLAFAVAAHRSAERSRRSLEPEALLAGYVYRAGKIDRNLVRLAVRELKEAG